MEIDQTNPGRDVWRYHAPRWLNLPRASYVLPVLVVRDGRPGPVLLQKNLGPALFLSCVFLAIYAVAEGGSRWRRPAWPFHGRVLHWISVERVRDAGGACKCGSRPGTMPYAAVDDRSIRLGALHGRPLRHGARVRGSRYVPAGHTDLVFAAAGEELGAAGLLAIAAIYAVIAARGFRIGLAAASDYGFFLSTAVTLFLVIPVLIMAAGMSGSFRSPEWSRRF